MRIDIASLLDHLPELIFVLDKDHRLLCGNKAFYQVTRLSREESLGQPLWSLRDPEKYEQFRMAFDQVFLTGMAVEIDRYDVEIDAHRRVCMVPFGEYVAVSCHDVTDLQRAIRELIWSNDVAHDLLKQFAVASRLAIAEQQTDALTGLASRSRIEDYVEGIFRVTRCKGLPLSFVIADVDHFKSHNDRFGHQVGDEILKRIAQTFMSVSDERHILGRYGGEEFLIILPNAGLDQAARDAEAYRVALANVDEFGVPVTSSFGVASTTETDTDWKSALLRADTALYEAKRQGRNRVVTLTEDQAKAA